MNRMRQGMSLQERQSLRDDIESDLLAEARSAAKLKYRSTACQQANRMAEEPGWTEDQVRAAHAKCLSEAQGSGCLDECHDPAE